MLKGRVCAAHMGGFFRSKIFEVSKQWSFVGRFSLNMRGFSRNLQNIVKNG